MTQNINNLTWTKKTSEIAKNAFDKAVAFMNKKFPGNTGDFESLKLVVLHQSWSGYFPHGFYSYDTPTIVVPPTSLLILRKKDVLFGMYTPNKGIKCTQETAMAAAMVNEMTYHMQTLNHDKKSAEAARINSVYFIMEFSPGIFQQLLSK